MITGRCYCGALKYEAPDQPSFKGQCHCRECQYMSGGGPNYFIAIAADSFRYSLGKPKSFARPDLPAPGSREFCENCGTHVLSRAPFDKTVVYLKVGTLDDPSVYGAPEAAIWTDDKQSFHFIPEGLATFPKFPES